MKLNISKEWCEQAAKLEGDSEVGDGCPPTEPTLTDLLERIKSLEGEVACLREERDGFKHEAEMWDEHMGPLTDYEGDEAPRQTIEREFDRLKYELNVCRAQSLQMQQEMEELRNIIEQCLDTGDIRVDEHKQLFLDANRVLGRNPQ